MAHDFSQFQSAYEQAPAERDNGGGGGEVPDGKYQVTVARVELRDSKQGNPMLDWELDILGPRQAGRKIWRKNMLSSADNIKWLKQDLYVCGVTLSHVNDLNDQRVLAKLIGVQLEVTKKTKGEYSNVYYDRRISVQGSAPSRPSPSATYDSSDVPF